jgi:hypothetical protein
MFSPLDEQALRKEGFVEGEAIRLWDGQTWHLPKPAIVGFYPRPSVDTPGKFDLCRSFDVGADYDALIDAYLGDPTLTNLIALAWVLLSRNYSLQPADLSGLLFRVMKEHPRYEENEAMFEAVADVCLGRAPKPSPAGSG